MWWWWWCYFMECTIHSHLQFSHGAEPLFFEIPSKLITFMLFVFERRTLLNCRLPLFSIFDLSLICSSSTQACTHNLFHKIFSICDACSLGNISLPHSSEVVVVGSFFSSLPSGVFSSCNLQQIKNLSLSSKKA